MRKHHVSTGRAALLFAAAALVAGSCGTSDEPIVAPVTEVATSAPEVPTSRDSTAGATSDSTSESTDGSAGDTVPGASGATAPVVNSTAPPAADPLPLGGANDRTACLDWPRNEFLMTVYSVPVGHPATRTVADLAQEGFTHVGPWYQGDRTPGSQMAIDNNICVIYPVGIQMPNDEAVQRVDELEGIIAADIAEVLANPELDESVTMWSLLPEELNIYREGVAEVFERLTNVIRENDPRGRPIYMYLQSNGDERQFEESARLTDVLGQGNYLSTNGLATQRIYLKASIARAHAAREVAGDGDTLVMPIVEHRIHEGRLAADLVPFVDEWVRHDLFLTYAMGADGFIAFSGFPPVENRDIFNLYNDAYTETLRAIHAANLPDNYARGEVVGGISAEVTAGPPTQSAEVLFIPRRGNDVETFETVTVRTWRLSGVDTTVVVNSAAEEVSARIDGLPATAATSDTGAEVRHDGSGFLVTLPAYGVVVLRSLS
jgi:hypothetical protein